MLMIIKMIDGTVETDFFFLSLRHLYIVWTVPVEDVLATVAKPIKSNVANLL